MVYSTDPNVMKATQDQRYVGLRGPKALGYVSLGHRPFQASDLNDFGYGQKLLESRDESDVDGVLPIGLIVNPLQIGNVVVRFDSVDVVDHREIARVRDERHRDDAMNQDAFALAVSPESRARVSQMVEAEDEHSSLASLWPIWANANSIQASNTAGVADFVNVFESGDRNGSPIFSNSDTHVAGCPSGYGRSTIKDPPHASTFGGSAIMASVSATFNRSHVDAG